MGLASSTNKTRIFYSVAGGIYILFLFLSVGAKALPPFLLQRSLGKEDKTNIPPTTDHSNQLLMVVNATFQFDFMYPLNSLFPVPNEKL